MVLAYLITPYPWPPMAQCQCFRRVLRRDFPSEGPDVSQFSDSGNAFSTPIFGPPKISYSPAIAVDPLDSPRSPSGACSAGPACRGSAGNYIGRTFRPVGSAGNARTAGTETSR